MKSYDSVKIISKEQMAPSIFKIGITCGGGFAKAVPGQFVMIRFPDQLTPLLSRPFSIHQLHWQDGQVTALDLLIKVVGQFTQQLSQSPVGTPINLLGPLGNGFRVSKNHQQIYIVAGGMGVAPMAFLVANLKKRGLPLSQGAAFLGGQSQTDILCIETFSRENMALTITTDDGSSGDQCFVTHPLEIALSRHVPDVIFACGPTGMLNCIVGIAKKYAVECQLSLETVMACGMGACLGCALPTNNSGRSYKHVCLDGPVFDAQELIER